MNKEELKARLQAAKFQKNDFWSRNFANIFLGVALLLLVIAAGIFIENYMFMQKAIKTEGTVINLHSASRRQGYAPDIEYFTGGNATKQIYYSQVYSRPPMYDIGEKVTIYYLENEPENASTGMSWIAIAIVGGLGILFLFFGIMFKKFF
jgi:hypothetical protein